MRQPAKNEGTVHNKKYEDYFHLLSKGRKKKTGKEESNQDASPSFVFSLPLSRQLTS